MTITTINKDEIQKFDELKPYDRFLYSLGGNIGDFFAFKINDKYAIFINGSGKFILARRYPNCLSIGANYITEYSTFDEAEAAAND